MCDAATLVIGAEIEFPIKGMPGCRMAVCQAVSTGIVRKTAAAILISVSTIKYALTHLHEFNVFYRLLQKLIR